MVCVCVGGGGGVTAAKRRKIVELHLYCLGHDGVVPKVTDYNP